MPSADYLQLILKQLGSQATPAEEAQLQNWLEADPQNRLEYQALVRIWNDSGQSLAAHSFDVEAALDKVRRRLTFETPETAKTPATPETAKTGTIFATLTSGAAETAKTGTPPRLFPWKRTLAAASVLLLAGSAAWWFLTHSGTPDTYAATNNNQTITLPDGSLVHLRKGATLSYNRNNRTADLSGEAFFEPRADIARPFLIRTAHAIYQDIGTSFLVNDQANADELTVVTGKVKFSEKANPSNNLVLKEGQKALLSGSQFTAPATGDPNALAWKTDVLDFKDQSLRDVAADIADYYQAAITIDPALAEKAADIKVTARFEHQPLKEVLDEVRLMTGLSTRKEKDTFVFCNK